MVPRPFKMSQVLIAVVSEYPLMEPVECPLSAATATLQLISIPGALPAWHGMARQQQQHYSLSVLQGRCLQAMAWPSSASFAEDSTSKMGERARAGGRREVGQAMIAMGAKQVLMQSSKHERECVTHCDQKRPSCSNCSDAFQGAVCN